MPESDALIDPIVLAIIVIEFVAFLFQFLYYLERPSDTSRKLYLILLFMLISYNVTGGLVPNSDLPVSLEIQYFIGHISAIAMSMYFIYYIYKVFRLDHLRWLSTIGPWLFLGIPFVVFSIFLFVTKDITFSQKILLPVPTLYGVVFVFQVIRFLITEYRNVAPEERGNYRIYLFSVVSAILCWILLPIVIFFQFNNVVEHVSTNLGLLFMTAVYIQSLVRDAQSEYQRLLRSEKKNKDLIEKLDNTIKNREKVIEERTVALKIANEQQRNNFVNLAHETKTPLTLILNYLNNYISEHGMNEDLAVIKYNLDKLTTDIINYFDIERLDRGINIYDHEQTANFSGILQNSLSLFRPLAENKDIRLLDNIAEDILVEADPDALVRIINNIVENAIKYTEPKGRISVSLCVQGDVGLLKVSDSGKGIPKAIQDKVLQPYFQASQVKRGSEGIGMGLAIVSKILQSLGGSITLSNNAVRGLLVEIAVPLQANSKVMVSAPTLSPPKVLLDNHRVSDAIDEQKKHSILVIEDHVSLLRYLTDKLSVEYNVYTASSGREALAKMKTISSLHLILSDIMMDDIDGFRFGQIIKNHPGYSHIPLVYMTAKSRSANELESLKLGAIAYVEKPFKMPVLLEKIRTILINTQRQNEAFVSQFQTIRLNHDIAPPSSLSFLKYDYDRFNLTNREIEIIHLVSGGLSNDEIADTLNISRNTVPTHMRNIFKKVGVNRRSDLIAKLKVEGS